MDKKMSPKVSVITFLTDKMTDYQMKFEKTLDAIVNQSRLPAELIVMVDAATEVAFDIESIEIRIVKRNHENLADWMNAGLDKCSGDYIVYLDNLNAEIELKKSYIETALLCAERNPDMGLMYADYDLLTDALSKEMHLLKHHIGRVRDNQDYGRVFFLRKEAIDDVGGFDSALKFKHLYDLRLKISEMYDLVHVANRYAGSLYSVVAQSKGHNVFDYLLAGKDVQLEAEKVVTEHLKRIGAYLEPGADYSERPADPDSEYVASVIIPVNNRPEFMESALGSVFAQSERNIEAIVVVNGGDSDPTVDEVRKYMPGGEYYDEKNPPVRLIITDINNIGLCLNLGVKVAKGRLYMQLDSDDRLKPSAVEKAVAMFESDKRIGIVIGSYEVWEKKLSGEFVRMESIPVVTHDEWTEDNGRNNLLRINGAGAPRCIPIAVIREMGYFGINDEPFARNYGEDYDMVLKISEKYRVGRVYDPVYEVVRHAGGTDHSIDEVTIDRNDEAKDYMRMVTIERRIELNRSEE